MSFIRDLVKETFNIHTDTAPIGEIIERIRSGATLNGTNMTILALAMVIASIGLNVNSTAVVIGAMLISPLMGVIMGVAFGFVTYDSRYTRRSLILLLLQTVFCIVASTVYFAISPIHTASSEIIARTSPTIWDVLIAIFGGFAGIIGQTRVEKSNVIPGVAIATALMPPLCTAGFGLANHMYSYFLGAIYLYFINCFFICVTSIIVLKILHLPAYKYTSDTTLKNQKKIFWILGLLVIIPSLWASYVSVMGQLQEIQLKSFIANEFGKDLTRQVVKYQVDEKDKTIYITLVGNELSKEAVDKLNMDVSEYHHLDGYKVSVVQNHYRLNAADLDSLLKEQGEAGNNGIGQMIDTNSPEFIKYKQAYALESHKEAVLDRVNDMAPVLFPDIVSIKGGLISYPIKGKGDAATKENKANTDGADKNVTKEEEVAYAMAVICTVKQPMPKDQVIRLKVWLEKEMGISVILSVVLSSSNVENVVYGNGIER